jgi:PIN domain nuclease of toxin-antitoxin system
VKLLLDTHAFLWWLFDDKGLSRKARAAISDRDNEVAVSAASAFEIETKYRLGKLPSAQALAGDVSGWIARAGFTELPISVAHATRAGSWPDGHRDPFDRILAAQAVLEEHLLVSRDPELKRFGVQLFW